MVVSRRNPVAPPPVASRTNSTQAIPRKQKLANVPSPLVVDEKPKPLARPRRTKVKGKQRPRTLSLLDRLFLLSLFGFVAYAATVCSSPWSSTNSPPVPYRDQPIACRTLIAYRTAILEPYVLPPLKFAYEHTLGHSIVTEQFASHVQPHLSTVKAQTQPVVDAAVAFNSRVVQPSVGLVYGKLWKSYIIPWYYRAYLPRYRMYIAPRLQAGWEHGVKTPLKPYTDLVRTYARDAQVYVHSQVIHRIKAWYYESAIPIYTSLQPKAVQAYETLEPKICATYQYAKATTKNVWVYAMPYLCKAWKATRVYVKVAVTEGGKARRMYVDPHVRTILERVRVSGNGNSSVSASATAVGDGTLEEEPTPTYESVPEPTSTEFAQHELEKKVVEIPVTPEPDIIPPGASPAEGVAAFATPGPIPSQDGAKKVEEELVQASVAAGRVEFSPAKTVEQSEPSRSVEAPGEDVAEKIANSFARRFKMMEKFAAEQAASTVEPTVSSTAAITATSNEEPEPRPSAVVEEELELDDFLVDLGINLPPSDTQVDQALKEDSADSNLPSEFDDEVESQSSEPELSQEEQLVAKKAATAEKRSKIVARHAEWQNKVNALVDEQMGNVVEGIEAVRVSASREIGDDYVGPAATVPAGGTEKAEGEEGLGKKAMGAVEKEGQRLVKGLASYLGKAISRSGNWKVTLPDVVPEAASGAQKALEEKDKWDEVVAKVDERFGATVKSVQGEVHEWYQGMKAREVDVALQAALAVKRLAESAQGDLAMGYAWLDDVTYRDWQNYHDLMRTYEQFEKTALAIQHGTHVPDEKSTQRILTYPDPVVEALNKLQSELDDIVLGFRLAVGGLNKKAIKVFSGRVYQSYDNDAETSDEGDVGEGFFSVKREKGELVDDMRGTPEYIASENQKPVVSILPVKPTLDDDAEQRMQDASAILLGKDAKQVEEAIRRAAALGEGVNVAKSEGEL